MTTAPFFSDKNILVTGASRGIGREFVRSLILDHGAQVIACTRKKLPASHPLAELSRSNKNLRLEQVDVEDPTSVTALKKSLSNLKQLDILINNAGVMLKAEQDLEDTSADNVLATFSVNAVGPLRILQALLPWLEKAREPVVANITSLMGSIQDNSSGGYYSYRMSKTALNMLNKSFSIDYPKIRSLVLHPGWVKTDMGGQSAPLSAENSVKGLLEVLRKTSLSDSGKFLGYDGRVHPW